MAPKKAKVAEIKTKPTSSSIDDFLGTIQEEQKRNDSKELLKIMKQVSGEEPVLWGSSIIGFGYKRYESPTSGRQVDWFKIGFSPRKANLTIYIIDTGKHSLALEKLGKHKSGGGCLYINKLADIDLKVLKNILEKAIKGS